MNSLLNKCQHICSSILKAGKLSADISTFFNLSFVFIFAYANRDKSKPRRTFFKFLSPFLQAATIGTLTVRIRFPHSIKTVTFSTEGPTEFWSIRSILQEVLIEKFYSIQLADSPQIIIDAGANIGVATLFLADAYPDATFFCYEPAQRNFELLEQNLKANNICHDAFRKALGKEAGQAHFQTGNSSMEHTLSEFAPQSESTRRETVTITTLAEEIETLTIPTIDLLKFDVEYAEEDLLIGCHHHLPTIKAMVGEVHSNALSNSINKLLVSVGFKVDSKGERLIAINQRTHQSQ